MKKDRKRQRLCTHVTLTESAQLTANEVNLWDAIWFTITARPDYVLLPPPPFTVAMTIDVSRDEAGVT